MANYTNVNEYKRVRTSGSFAFRATGDQVTVNEDKVVLIYWAGTGYETNGTTTHEVFTVELDGAPTIITDWAGIGDIGNFVRVNDYKKLVQEDGSVLRQYTGRGARIVPNNVTKWVPIGTVYGQDPNDTYDGFRVHLIDGSTVVTDQDGIDLITGY
jgi:hypothetical protein